MKSIILTCTMATIVFALATAPTRLLGQAIGDDSKHLHYSVQVLEGIGGTASRANSINDQGWVTGWSEVYGDTAQHATLWRNGVFTDLGTLGGLNSQVEFPDKNKRGIVLGGAEISASDPFAENFCNFGSNLICLPFMWRNGVMTPLPTLGGNNGYATDLNDRGQAVGFAETATNDPNCITPQVFDFEAVMWELKSGEVQELPHFPGDRIAAALAINDKGQAVGGSGVCESPLASFNASLHAVLWPHGPNGEVIDLGTFGGVMSNLAFYINSKGQVVGISDLPGDATGHAFLWENGVLTDLGTLPGDFYSVAYGINDNSQVVGQSCDVDFNCRAFLWQDGVMMDLNSLIPASSGLYLVDPADINSRGEIAGQGYDPVTGNSPAFLALPCHEKPPVAEGCETEAAAATRGLGESHEIPKVILPAKLRDQLHQHRLRFGAFGATRVRSQ
jgi:probable HAF family extracellular repeat protein